MATPCRRFTASRIDTNSCIDTKVTLSGKFNRTCSEMLVGLRSLSGIYLKHGELHRVGIERSALEIS